MPPRSRWASMPETKKLVRTLTNMRRYALRKRRVTGTEGERANESGGTLNPALLNIG